jgi:hypothetical protein
LRFFLEAESAFSRSIDSKHLSATLNVYDLIHSIQEAHMTVHKHHHRRHYPILWIFWPFKAIWMLLATIVEMTGRLLAMIIGFLLVVVGVILSLTIIGAIIGIPLAIIGFLLILRGIF